MFYYFLMNLIIGSTIMAGLLTILILIIKLIFKNLISAKWHYIIWFVLLLRLSVPYIVYSPFNISDLFKGLYIEVASVNDVGLQISDSNTISSTVDIPDKPENHSIITKKNEVDTIGKTAGVIKQRFSANNSLKKLVISINQIKINYRLIFLIWILGVVILSLYAFLYNFYFWTKVKNGSVFTDQETIEILEECKQTLNIHTNISIIQTSGVGIPAIFGITRPWLLMPEKVLKTLERENLRYVFLHELAHLKRRDILVNWISFLMQIIHWFNPFIWLAFNKMRLDRELACDEVVLMHLDRGEVKKYGHTILDMVEIVSGKVNYAGIAGILENKSQIKDRISRISRFGNKNGKLSAMSIIIVMLLASSILVNAGNFSGKAVLQETKANSTSAIESSTVNNLELKTTPTENKENSLNLNSSQVIKEEVKNTSTGDEDNSQNPNSSQVTKEEEKPQQQKSNIPTQKSSDKVARTPEKRSADTSKTMDSKVNESIVTNNDNSAKPQSNNEQIELKDLKIKAGIEVSTDSVSGNHTVYIDKNKLPAGLPEVVNMSLVSADDVSDDSIQSMVSYHIDHKLISWQVDGRTGEYYRWADDGKKFTIILLFDTNMKYLGYYTHQNP
jgi:beta-lactamase regulating signal transducer with metallopeptidase domain